MGTDVVPHSGGGALVVTDGVRTDLALRSQPGATGHEHELELSQQPMLSDEEHFEAFGKSVGMAFQAAGIRDQALVQKVVDVAEQINREVGAGTLPMELPKLAAAFGQHLVRAGVSDAKALCTAMGAGFQYLLAIKELHEEARDDVDFLKQRKALKELWASNFKQNAKAALDYLNDKVPESLKDVIIDGTRDSMGLRIGYSARVMQWLAELALGSAAGGPGPGREALERELADIKETVRTNRRKYDGDARMRMRYQELIELLGHG